MVSWRGDNELYPYVTRIVNISKCSDMGRTMSTVYGVGDEMTLQAITRDAASTDPAQPHLDHYPRPYYPLVGDPPPPDIGTGYYQPPPVPQGWQCPMCKTVYAPSVLQCRCAIENAIALHKRSKEATK